MDLSKVSMHFSKKKEKSLLRPSAFSEKSVGVSYEDNSTEIITTFDRNMKRKASTQRELVIPLLQSNQETTFQKIEKEVNLCEQYTSITEIQDKSLESDRSEMTLDQIAAAELIKETSIFNNEKSKVSDQRSINYENPMKDGSEANLDGGEISSLDDYDKVEVDSYGAALLRGMGWKKDKGIGKLSFKRVVEIIDPTAGQMFGQINKKKGSNITEDFDDELSLVKGCHIFIHSGRHRGVYGIVESLDCDHLIVCPALDSRTIREVEANVKVVSKSEYKDCSKVINKDMYDKFKGLEKDKEPVNHHSKEDSANFSSKDSKRGINSDQLNEETQKKIDVKVEKFVKPDRCSSNNFNLDATDIVSPETESTYSSNRDKFTSKENNFAKYSSKDSNNKKYNSKYCVNSSNEVRSNGIEFCGANGKKGKRRPDEAQKYFQNDSDYDLKHHRESQLSIPVIPWARENLRVRLISKLYKGGSYHKEKMRVECVDTVKSCTCIMSDGKVLYDIDPDCLETVIPKEKDSIVLIVKGSDKGQKARILQIDKEKEKATIQLLQDRAVILTLHFEDICEYVTR